MKLSIIYHDQYLIHQEKPDSEVVVRIKGSVEPIILDNEDERVRRLFEVLDELIQK